MFGLKRIHGDLKVECLESLIPNITQFDLIYLELRASGILEMIGHKDFAIRSVALRLIFKLLPTLTHDQLFEISETLNIDGPNECQHSTLEIFKWIYDYLTKSIEKETIVPYEQFYHHVRSALLEFLSSKSEEIRLNARNFWCDPKRFSTSSEHRLIAIVDQLYSNRCESNYLNYSTNFLLERASHSPDYSRTLFEHPLDECSFYEFPLNSDWRQRHQLFTTPLFTIQTQSKSNNPMELMKTFSTQFPLMETQQMLERQQFVPTQMNDGSTSSHSDWLKQPSTLDVQSKPNENQDDIFRLQRRFLKDNGQLHSHFARQQREKKEKEKSFLQEIKLKQEHQVEKYRRYRIGELPDIEIRFSDIIIPLQALAEHDTEIARLLFVSLFKSIFISLAERLSTDEFNEFLSTIQNRFNRMFEQSEVYFSAFFAAIFDILLGESNEIRISASNITTASLASRLEPLGILTLESYIRSFESKDFLPLPQRKKFKSSTGNELHQQTDYWLELAKCSRSINNYDDVRAIFTHLPTLKPSTIKAIDDETRCDFFSALNTYLTALTEHHDEPSNSIFDLEQEFWTQSILNCCNQLSQWSIMSKNVFLPSVNFDTLFSDNYHLKTLMPYGIRSKLKLLILGDEQEQLDQEDLARWIAQLMNSNQEEDLVKRKFIEKQYPFELATFFLYQKDFERKLNDAIDEMDLKI